jgi:hypothetical protein
MSSNSEKVVSPFAFNHGCVSENRSDDATSSYSEDELIKTKNKKRNSIRSRQEIVKKTRKQV